MAAPRSKGLWPAVKILLLRVATPGFAPGRHLIALPFRPDEPARRRIFPAHPILVVIEIALARLRFTSQSVKKEYLHIPARSDYDRGDQCPGRRTGYRRVYR